MSGEDKGLGFVLLEPEVCLIETELPKELIVQLPGLQKAQE